ESCRPAVSPDTSHAYPLAPTLGPHRGRGNRLLRLLPSVDAEDARETRDLEDLPYALGRRAQHDLAVHGAEALEGADEGGQAGRVHERHVGHVDDHVRLPAVGDGDEGFADAPRR